jgi:hypothetical protein
VGERQRACSGRECQKERQRRNEGTWRARNPEYPARRRIQLRARRAAKGEAVDPLGVRAPLTKLPWDVAQKQFKLQGADFLRECLRVLALDAKKQIQAQATEIAKDFRGHPPEGAQKERSALAP